MNRRYFLQSLPFFGMAATLPAVAVAEPDPVDLDARVMYHVEQIKKIRMMQNPQIKHWHLTDPSLLKGCQGEGSIILMAESA